MWSESDGSSDCTWQHDLSDEFMSGKMIDGKIAIIVDKCELVGTEGQQEDGFGGLFFIECDGGSFDEMKHNIIIYHSAILQLSPINDRHIQFSFDILL